MKQEIQKRQKFWETDDKVPLDFFLKREFSTIVTRIPIIRTLMTIGRAFECTIPLKSKRVSRIQCEISFRDGKVYVRDNGSSNGTFINDVRIKGEHELKLGDMIGFGIRPIPIPQPDDKFYIFSLCKVPDIETIDLTDDTQKDTLDDAMERQVDIVDDFCDRVDVIEDENKTEDHNYTRPPHTLRENDENDDYVMDVEMEFKDEEEAFHGFSSVDEETTSSIGEIFKFRQLSEQQNSQSEQQKVESSKQNIESEQSVCEINKIKQQSSETEQQIIQTEQQIEQKNSKSKKFSIKNIQKSRKYVTAIQRGKTEQHYTLNGKRLQIRQKNYNNRKSLEKTEQQNEISEDQRKSQLNEKHKNQTEQQEQNDEQNKSKDVELESEQQEQSKKVNEMCNGPKVRTLTKQGKEVKKTEQQNEVRKTEQRNDLNQTEQPDEVEKSEQQLELKSTQSGKGNQELKENEQQNDKTEQQAKFRRKPDNFINKPSTSQFEDHGESKKANVSQSSVDESPKKTKLSKKELKLLRMKNLRNAHRFKVFNGENCKSSKNLKETSKVSENSKKNLDVNEKSKNVKETLENSKILTGESSIKSKILKSFKNSKKNYPKSGKYSAKIVRQHRRSINVENTLNSEKFDISKFNLKECFVKLVRIDETTEVKFPRKSPLKLSKLSPKLSQKLRENIRKSNEQKSEDTSINGREFFKYAKSSASKKYREKICQSQKLQQEIKAKRLSLRLRRESRLKNESLGMNETTLVDESLANESENVAPSFDFDTPKNGESSSKVSETFSSSTPKPNKVSKILSFDSEEPKVANSEVNESTIDSSNESSLKALKAKRKKNRWKNGNVSKKKFMKRNVYKLRKQRNEEASMNEKSSESLENVQEASKTVNESVAENMSVNGDQTTDKTIESCPSNSNEKPQIKSNSITSIIERSELEVNVESLINKTVENSLKNSREFPLIRPKINENFNRFEPENRSGNKEISQVSSEVENLTSNLQSTSSSNQQNLQLTSSSDVQNLKRKIDLSPQISPKKLKTNDTQNQHDDSLKPNVPTEIKKVFLLQTSSSQLMLQSSNSKVIVIKNFQPAPLLVQPKKILPQTLILQQNGVKAQGKLQGLIGQTSSNALMSSKSQFDKSLPSQASIINQTSINANLTPLMTQNSINEEKTEQVPDKLPQITSNKPSTTDSSALVSQSQSDKILPSQSSSDKISIVESESKAVSSPQNVQNSPKVVESQSEKSSLIETSNEAPTQTQASNEIPPHQVSNYASSLEPQNITKVQSQPQTPSENSNLIASPQTTIETKTSPSNEITPPQPPQSTQSSHPSSPPKSIKELLERQQSKPFNFSNPINPFNNARGLINYTSTSSPTVVPINQPSKVNGAIKKSPTILKNLLQYNKKSMKKSKNLENLSEEDGLKKAEEIAKFIKENKNSLDSIANPPKVKRKYVKKNRKLPETFEPIEVNEEVIAKKNVLEIFLKADTSKVNDSYAKFKKSPKTATQAKNFKSLSDDEGRAKKILDENSIALSLLTKNKAADENYAIEYKKKPKKNKAIILSVDKLEGNKFDLSMFENSSANFYEIEIEEENSQENEFIEIINEEEVDDEGFEEAANEVGYGESIAEVLTKNREIIERIDEVKVGESSTSFNGQSFNGESSKKIIESVTNFTNLNAESSTKFIESSSNSAAKTLTNLNGESSKNFIPNLTTIESQTLPTFNGESSTKFIESSSCKILSNSIGERSAKLTEIPLKLMSENNSNLTPTLTNKIQSNLPYESFSNFVVKSSTNVEFQSQALPEESSLHPSSENITNESSPKLVESTSTLASILIESSPTSIIKSSSDFEAESLNLLKKGLNLVNESSTLMIKRSSNRDCESSSTLVNESFTLVLEENSSKLPIESSPIKTVPTLPIESSEVSHDESPNLGTENSTRSLAESFSDLPHETSTIILDESSSINLNESSLNPVDDTVIILDETFEEESALDESTSEFLNVSSDSSFVEDTTEILVNESVQKIDKAIDSTIDKETIKEFLSQFNAKKVAAEVQVASSKNNEAVDESVSEVLTPVEDEVVVEPQTARTLIIDEPQNPPKALDETPFYELPPKSRSPSIEAVDEPQTSIRDELQSTSQTVNESSLFSSNFVDKSPLLSKSRSSSIETVVEDVAKAIDKDTLNLLKLAVSNIALASLKPTSSEATSEEVFMEVEEQLKNIHEEPCKEIEVDLPQYPQTEANAEDIDTLYENMEESLVASEFEEAETEIFIDSLTEESMVQEVVEEESMETEGNICEETIEEKVVEEPMEVDEAEVEISHETNTEVSNEKLVEEVEPEMTLTEEEEVGPDVEENHESNIEYNNETEIHEEVEPEVAEPEDEISPADEVGPEVENDLESSIELNNETAVHKEIESEIAEPEVETAIEIVMSGELLTEEVQSEMQVEAEIEVGDQSVAFEETVHEGIASEVTIVDEIFAEQVSFEVAESNDAETYEPPALNDQSSNDGPIDTEKTITEDQQQPSMDQEVNESLVESEPTKPQPEPEVDPNYEAFSKGLAENFDKTSEESRKIPTKRRISPTLVQKVKEVQEPQKIENNEESLNTSSESSINVSTEVIVKPKRKYTKRNKSEPKAVKKSKKSKNILDKKSKIYKAKSVKVKEAKKTKAKIQKLSKSKNLIEKTSKSQKPKLHKFKINGIVTELEVDSFGFSNPSFELKNLKIIINRVSLPKEEAPKKVRKPKDEKPKPKKFKKPKQKPEDSASKHRKPKDKSKPKKLKNPPSKPQKPEIVPPEPELEVPSLKPQNSFELPNYSKSPSISFQNPLSVYSVPEIPSFEQLNAQQFQNTHKNVQIKIENTQNPPENHQNIDYDHIYVDSDDDDESYSTYEIERTKRLKVVFEEEEDPPRSILKLKSVKHKKKISFCNSVYVRTFIPDDWYGEQHYNGEEEDESDDGDDEDYRP